VLRHLPISAVLAVLVALMLLTQFAAVRRLLSRLKPARFRRSP